MSQLEINLNSSCKSYVGNYHARHEVGKEPKDVWSTTMNQPAIDRLQEIWDKHKEKGPALLQDLICWYNDGVNEAKKDRPIKLPFKDCQCWTLDGLWTHKTQDGIRTSIVFLDTDFTHCPFCGHERA